MMHAVVERAHALMRTRDYEICACACHAVTAAATTAATGTAAIMVVRVSECARRCMPSCGNARAEPSHE